MKLLFQHQRGEASGVRTAGIDASQSGILNHCVSVSWFGCLFVFVSINHMNLVVFVVLLWLICVISGVIFRHIAPYNGGD